MTSDTLLADNEVFKKYIIEVLDRTIPDIYKSTQGRIVKKAKGENSNNFIKYYKGIYLFECDNNSSGKTIYHLFFSKNWAKTNSTKYINK